MAEQEPSPGSGSPAEFTTLERRSRKSRGPSTGQFSKSKPEAVPLSDIKYSLTPEFLSCRRKIDFAMDADISSEIPISFNPKRVRVEFNPVEEASTPVTPVSTEDESMAPPRQNSNGEPAKLNARNIPKYLDLVKDRPIIWDAGHEDHRKINRKRDAWEEVVSSLKATDNLHFTVEQLKGHWKRTRTSFKAAMKQYEEGRRVTFTYFKKCKFLLPRDLRDQLVVPSIENEQTVASLNVPKQPPGPDFSPTPSSASGFSPDVNNTNPIDWVKNSIAQRKAQSHNEDQAVNGSSALRDSTSSPDGLESFDHDYFHHFGMFVAGYLRTSPTEDAAKMINEITGRLMASNTH